MYRIKTFTGESDYISFDFRKKRYYIKDIFGSKDTIGIYSLKDYIYVLSYNSLLSYCGLTEYKMEEKTDTLLEEIQCIFFQDNLPAEIERIMKQRFINNNELIKFLYLYLN